MILDRPSRMPPTNPPNAPFEVARSDEALYVRIRGLGSMKNAPTLETLANKALDEGARSLVFDFVKCTGVDSTFMGLLLSLTTEVKERDGGGVVLINVDDHARRQLASVGVDAFVTIREGESKLPHKVRLTPVEAVYASESKRLKLIVKAHKQLVASDERNRAKFGPFLEGILAELE